MLHSRSEILAKAISKTSCQSNKQTFMPPPLPPLFPPSLIDFKHECHNNKKVVIITLRGIERRPLYQEPAVIPTPLLFHDRGYIVIFIHDIVIRNGKLVWKVVWIGYCLRLNLSSRRYQNPGYLSIHQMETLNVLESQYGQNNCVIYM